jgi:hypothetical protein
MLELLQRVCGCDRVQTSSSEEEDEPNEDPSQFEQDESGGTWMVVTRDAQECSICMNQKVGEVWHLPRCTNRMLVQLRMCSSCHATWNDHGGGRCIVCCAVH